MSSSDFMNKNNFQLRKLKVINLNMYLIVIQEINKEL